MMSRALLALLLAATVFCTTPVTTYNDGLDFDGRFYAAMSAPEGKEYMWSHHAPWCWRVLTPAIAGMLPSDPVTNFRAVALVSAFLTLILLGILLEKCGASKSSELFGVTLYATTFFPLKWSFFSPCYIDHQTQLFILAVLVALSFRFFLALPALIAVACLQKESLIFLTLPSALYAWSLWKSSKKAQLYFLALLIPAFVAIGATRLMIAPVNKYSSEAVFLYTISTQLSDWAFYPRFMLAIFSGLGIFPLLLLLRRKAVTQFLYDNPHWALYLFLAAVQLFGGMDKARLFLPMLPVLVVVTVRVFPFDTLLIDWRGRAFLFGVLSLNIVLGMTFWWGGDYHLLYQYQLPILTDRSLTPATVRLGVVVVTFFALSLIVRKQLSSSSEFRS